MFHLKRFQKLHRLPRNPSLSKIASLYIVWNIFRVCVSKSMSTGNRLWAKFCITWNVYSNCAYLKTKSPLFYSYTKKHFHRLDKIGNYKIISTKKYVFFPAKQFLSSHIRNRLRQKYLKSDSFTLICYL